MQDPGSIHWGEKIWRRRRKLTPEGESITNVRSCTHKSDSEGLNWMEKRQCEAGPATNYWLQYTGPTHRFIALGGILKWGRGEADRQIDRQTERQTDSQTGRQRDRQTERQTDRQIDRQTDRRTERETDRQTERERDRRKERQTDRQTDRQIDGQKER